MTTTIKKTVKGSTMEALFDNCKTFSIRYYNAENIDEENYNPNRSYKYTIVIRHPENTGANLLFESARFEHENLSSSSSSNCDKNKTLS